MLSRCSRVRANNPGPNELRATALERGEKEHDGAFSLAALQVGRGDLAAERGLHDVVRPLAA